MVTYPYAYMTYIVSPLAGLGGGISWRPPAYSLLNTLLMQHIQYIYTEMKHTHKTLENLKPNIIYKREPHCVLNCCGGIIYSS